MVHPEHRLENSLTAPSDRNPDRSYKPNQTHPELTSQEVKDIKEHNLQTLLPKMVERRYMDTEVPATQLVGLVSFVPAKGATPNKSGVYGFCKIRGNYPTVSQADERAEYLIKNVDSYHKIYTVRVGFPFPMTESSDFSEEVNEIDIRKELSESVSNSIKGKKKDEQKIIQEIEESERALKEDVEKGPDPIDQYTTLKVKKAQTVWTYLETRKKLDELKNIIIKTRREIAEMDDESEEYQQEYYQKYLDARKRSGFKDDVSGKQDQNFMKFLVEDGADELGF